ncbi:DinB family protein [Mycolicibacterium neoaurum]|uniref:DinB superfamily protein n=1 Tax=Mycolicibacterium neoaurum TaxID=1795 RepID=A0AAV2WS94_MYCNE|nr:DinB family protein [Mycolicibacterium neoaurum]TLH59040.1 DinB family protein [Mycolicibacterium neoaurum]CDQ46923.1 DinB superfamily protein [Mycolicibacterium neoaurum]
MPAMPPPVADERAGLKEYVAAQQYAFRAIAFGLTDEQARSTPSVSALSIGGLIKHVTSCQKGWMQRVAAAPQLPAADDRPMEDVQAEYAEEFVMREDETLAGILAAFDEQNAETIRLIETADLAAAVPVPQEVPWFPKDVAAWSVRWVIFHMIEELARHAGQGDIIRESIDGATLYELLAGLEDWEPTPWLTPWGKEAVS